MLKPIVKRENIDKITYEFQIIKYVHLTINLLNKLKLKDMTIMTWNNCSALIFLSKAKALCTSN